MRRILSTFMALFAATLLLAACGDGATDTSQTVTDEVAAVPNEVEEATPAETADTVSAPPDKVEAEAETEDMINEMKENLEERQAAEGGGHATFATKEQTWEFDTVMCSFGKDDDAEFVLTSIQDGLQLHVMISSIGHTMSLNDVTDFENPSVSLSEFPTAGEFLVVDGKNVTGEAPVYDSGDDTLTQIEATVEATCP